MAKYLCCGYFCFDYTVDARALKAPKKFLSESYCSNISQNKFNKPGDNHFTKSTKKQKSIACYFGEINKTTKESTEAPRFGSFIDYVEIAGSNEVFYTLPYGLYII